MAGGEVLCELWLDGVHRARKVLVSGVTPSWATRGDASMSMGSRRGPVVAGLSGASWDAEVSGEHRRCPWCGVHGLGELDFAAEERIHVRGFDQSGEEKNGSTVARSRAAPTLDSFYLL